MPLRSKPRFATGLQSLLKPGNLLNLALILVLILPVNAKAQNATTLISAIDAVTGLKATPNAANPNTTVVTVTGTATNNATLTLSIPSGVTLLWKASLTGSTSADALLKITNGHIEVTTDGKIEQTGSQTALSHTGEANSNSVTISGTGTVLMNANSSNCAIASDNTVVTVKDNAVVSVTSGSAIYTAWADVVINGGTISATSGNAIYMYGANRSVTINGGTISATTGYAVYSLSSAINVNGGTISATTGNALHIHNSQTITISGGRISATTGYAARSSYINISGGVVFAYYSSSTNNEIDDVLWTVSNGLSITGTGVVIGWRNQTTPITYSSGTSTNIFMFPANCAQWDFSGQGIRYTNGSNTGVITIPGVTVNAAVPPAITTSSLPNGTAGVAYNQTLAATGATPITWSIESGSLPAGLSLNGTAGTISGTPTAAGTSTFIVKATNTGGNVTRELSITVSAGAFVPVTGITGVPASATAGVPLTLTGTVNPSNATSQTITWSMLNNGATGATISGNTFNAATAGTATVRATIVNGTAQGTNYTQDFNITVSAGAGSFVPVTGITGVPATATAGIPLALTGTVNPSNATNKTITWSMQNNGTTGATISGNTFNAATAGTATVRATIANGTAQGANYTQDFTITVSAGASSFVPVTGITGLPTTATVGIPLQLSGTVVPSNATNKNITWSIWDAVTTGATISGNTFNASGDGTAHVAATIANGIAPGIDYVQYFVITLNRGIAPITINTQAEWDLLSGSMASWSGNTVVLNRNVTGDLTLNNNTTTLIIEGNGNTITGRIFSPLNIPINLTLKNVTVNSAGNTGYASIHLYGGMLTTEGKVFLNGNYNPNSESPGSGIASWGDLTINADENATFTGGRAAVNTGAAVFVNYGNLTVNGSAKFVGGGAGVSIIGNGNLTVLSGSPSFTGGESTTGDVGAYIDGDLIISSTGSPTFTGSDGNGQTYHRGATIRGNLRISAGTPSFKGGSISATNVTSGYHAGEGARILGSVIISGNASPSFTGGNHPISGNGGFGVSLGDNNMTVSTSGTVTFTAGSNGFTGIWADDKTIDLSRLTGKLTATGQTTAIYLYTGSIIYPAGLARSLEYDGTSPSYTLTVGSGTSAEVLFAPDLKIYPNPFTDAVHIAGVDIETGRMPLLQVINSSGMTIHTQLITKPDEIIRLHHLPAGVYFFRVEKDGRVRTLKGVRIN